MEGGGRKGPNRTPKVEKTQLVCFFFIYLFSLPSRIFFVPDTVPSTIPILTRFVQVITMRYYDYPHLMGSESDLRKVMLTANE